jgi:hypothetical protein
VSAGGQGFSQVTDVRFGQRPGQAGVGGHAGQAVTVDVG